MKFDTHVRHTGLTDVRNNTWQSRVRVALMSTGIAGTMLMSGLLGFQGTAAAATVQMTKSDTAIVAQSHGSYVNIARQAARAAGISPTYFVNQIQQESGFNPYAHSPAGAVGIAQFMPATAASMGVNPYNPTSALYGGARLMAQLRAQFGGNYAKALAAYNAGPGAVIAAERAGGRNWLAYTPAETQHYVHVILR